MSTHTPIHADTNTHTYTVTHTQVAEEHGMETQKLAEDNLKEKEQQVRLAEIRTHIHAPAQNGTRTHADLTQMGRAGEAD
jgi:hypothetical protein